MEIEAPFLPQDYVGWKKGLQVVKNSAGVWLRLVPAVGLMVLLYLGGLALAFVQSLGYFPALGLNDISFDAYLTLFHRPDFLRSLLLTLWVSLVSTAVATILALAAALLLRSIVAGKPWLTFIYKLNLSIPHVVGAIGIYLLLTQSGLLARLVYRGNLITSPGEFPALVFDPYAIGIIAEYVWKFTVFIGVNLLAAMQTIGEDYEAVAGTLGAGTWQRFRYVLLPMLKPSLVSSSILVFAFSFGGYEVPYLLGRRSGSLLPVLAYREYNQVDLMDRPQAMAISIIISLAVTILVWWYMQWTTKDNH